MKLRLLDNSIRLRLSRGDVDIAASQGVVEGQTRFPGGAVLTYAVEAAAQTGASFADGRLVVRFNAADLSAWAGNDSAVSLNGELALPDGNHLTLLVEKDFECLTPRDGEDQSDMFPNPDSNC